MNEATVKVTYPGRHTLISFYTDFILVFEILFIEKSLKLL